MQVIVCLSLSVSVFVSVYGTKMFGFFLWYQECSGSEDRKQLFLKLSKAKNSYFGVSEQLFSKLCLRLKKTIKKSNK